MEIVVSHRGRSARGFSLLELLVVVFIIGVLATMFTLSVGVIGGDSELETEVRRLQALVRLAREESVTQGQDYGLRFYPDGYEFAAYFEDFLDYRENERGERVDESEWRIVANDSLLTPRRLPEGLKIEVEIDGREIVLPKRGETLTERDDDDPDDEEADDAAAYRPQVWIYSSGDISPFMIRLRRELGDRTSELEFAADGDVELREL